MKKNILGVVMGVFLGVGSALASAPLWEGVREEVVARIKAHEVHFTYGELESLILPVLHQDLHEDFRKGFGELFKAPEGRLPIPTENKHIACLYESLDASREFDIQQLTLYSMLNVPAHLAYFSEEFTRKIQG